MCILNLDVFRYLPEAVIAVLHVVEMYLSCCWISDSRNTIIFIEKYKYEDKFYCSKVFKNCKHERVVIHW